MVLIPSVVTRPLSVLDTYRGTLFVYYGIADEFIDSDPEAPPSWLVRTYKALSDERRLRIMRRLGEGPASLDDVSDLLGVSKSTAPITSPFCVAPVSFVSTWRAKDRRRRRPIRYGSRHSMMPVPSSTPI